MTERVILLHGLWLRGMAMNYLSRRLGKAGFDAQTFDYATVRGGIDDASERLRELIGTFGGGTVHPETYVQGTLVVDLYDARTRKMIWRGVDIENASHKPSKNTDKIDRAVSMMFQRYPR